MFWLDYTVESLGLHGQAFRVKGDWDDEVMGKNEDGSNKDYWLYKPGDVFIVDENGWLRKTDQVNTLLMKYEEGKKNGHSSSD
jgi:hypothetical protein